MNKSRQGRNWVDLLAFCLLRVVALSLAFAAILVGGTLAFAGADPPQASGKKSQFATVTEQSFSGVITDSECSARHNKDAKLSSAECARFCVRNGAKYTLVNGETNYLLNGNTNEFAKLAGQRVKVAGTRDGNTIQVSSLSPQ
jgi:hypothetical protein